MMKCFTAYNIVQRVEHKSRKYWEQRLIFVGWHIDSLMVVDELLYNGIVHF